MWYTFLVVPVGQLGRVRIPVHGSIRRAVHVAVLTVTAVLLALPLLLGPATTTIVRALGGVGEHHCACGMDPGTCGCPECERVTQEKETTAEHLRGHAVLRSSCDDGTSLPAIGALPFAAVPVVATLPPMGFELLALARPTAFDPSLERARPPTPPPRRAGA